MIPEPHKYLSFLMGADAIADHELTSLGVKILKGGGSAFRGLLIPEGSLSAYKALVREKITPGYWNDILGRQEILFIFKLTDGTVAVGDHAPQQYAEALHKPLKLPVARFSRAVGRARHE